MPASPRERIELAEDGASAPATTRPSAGETAPYAVTPDTWGPQPLRNAWYRTRFASGPADPDQRVYVSFEGVATAADVYLNGTHLGRHLGAYTAFTLDATPALVPGDNVLSVRVSNHPQDTVDSLPSGAGKQLYRLYGGIYRKAWLVKTRSAHFDPLDHGSSGVYVTPSNVTADAADLAVRARVRNASSGERALRFVARLVDADGREVATERQELDVPPGQVVEARVQRRLASPRLWDLKSPHLYRCTRSCGRATAWSMRSPSARASAISA